MAMRQGPAARVKKELRVSRRPHSTPVAGTLEVLPPEKPCSAQSTGSRPLSANADKQQKEQMSRRQRQKRMLALRGGHICEADVEDRRNISGDQNHHSLSNTWGGGSDNQNNASSPSSKRVPGLGASLQPPLSPRKQKSFMVTLEPEKASAWTDSCEAEPGRAAAITRGRGEKNKDGRKRACGNSGITPTEEVREICINEECRDNSPYDCEKIAERQSDDGYADPVDDVIAEIFDDISSHKGPTKTGQASKQKKKASSKRKSERKKLEEELAQYVHSLKNRVSEDTGERLVEIPKSLEDDFSQWGASLLPAAPTKSDTTANGATDAGDVRGSAKRPQQREKPTNGKLLTTTAQIHPSIECSPPAVRRAESKMKIGDKQCDQGEVVVTPPQKADDASPSSPGSKSSMNQKGEDEVSRVPLVDDFVPPAPPMEAAKRSKILLGLEQKNKDREVLESFVKDLRARSAAGSSRSDGSRTETFLQFPENFEKVANLITKKDLDVLAQKEKDDDNDGGPKEELKAVSAQISPEKGENTAGEDVPSSARQRKEVVPTVSSSQGVDENKKNSDQWFSIALEHGINKAEEKQRKNSISTRSSRRVTPRNKTPGSRGRSRASSSSSRATSDGFDIDEIERGLALITQLDRELVETTMRATELASSKIDAPEDENHPPPPSPLPIFNKVLAMSNPFKSNENYDRNHNEENCPQTQEPAPFSYSKEEKYASDRQAFAMFAKVAAESKGSQSKSKRNRGASGQNVGPPVDSQNLVTSSAELPRSDVHHRKTGGSLKMQKRVAPGNLKESGRGPSSKNIHQEDDALHPIPGNQRCEMEGDREKGGPRSMAFGSIRAGNKGVTKPRQDNVAQSQEYTTNTFVTQFGRQDSETPAQNNRDEFADESTCGLENNVGLQSSIHLVGDSPKSSRQKRRGRPHESNIILRNKQLALEGGTSKSKITKEEAKRIEFILQEDPEVNIDTPLASLASISMTRKSDGGGFRLNAEESVRVNDVDERLRQFASLRGYYVPADVWGDPAALGLNGSLATYEDIVALGNPAQARQSAWAASIIAESSDWTKQAPSRPGLDSDSSIAIVRNSIGNRYLDENREERALRKRERFIDVQLRKLQAPAAGGDGSLANSVQCSPTSVTIADKTKIQEELAKASIMDQNLAGDFAAPSREDIDALVSSLKEQVMFTRSVEEDAMGNDNDDFQHGQQC